MLVLYLNHIFCIRFLLTRFLLLREGSSGQLKYELEGHAMGVISVDVSSDGTRKYFLLKKKKR
jgi:hypothetical protein